MEIVFVFDIFWDFFDFVLLFFSFVRSLLIFLKGRPLAVGFLTRFQPSMNGHQSSLRLLGLLLRSPH